MAGFYIDSENMPRVEKKNIRTLELLLILMNHGMPNSKISFIGQ
jgi:hypothetical protein